MYFKRQNDYMRVKNPYEADKLKHGPAGKKTGEGAVDPLRAICNVIFAVKKLDVEWLEATD